MSIIIALFVGVALGWFGSSLFSGSKISELEEKIRTYELEWLNRWKE